MANTVAPPVSNGKAPARSTLYFTVDDDGFINATMNMPASMRRQDHMIEAGTLLDGYDLENLQGLKYDKARGTVSRVLFTPTKDLVDEERDRRIVEGFTFGGEPFDFDEKSKVRVSGAATLAGFAMAQGAGAGYNNWNGNPKEPFSWLSNNNKKVVMDAPTCFAFGAAAAEHERGHIFAARALKDQDPIPADYTDDKYWP